MCTSNGRFAAFGQGDILDINNTPNFKLGLVHHHGMV